MSSRMRRRSILFDVRDDGVHVEQSRLQHLVPAERQDLTGQLGRAMRRGDDDLGITALRLIGSDALEERLPGPEDHRQQVVEVMGDTGGETPDGFHLFRRLQRAFQAQPRPCHLQLGDVLGDHQEVARLAPVTDDRDPLGVHETKGAGPAENLLLRGLDPCAAGEGFPIPGDKGICLIGREEIVVGLSEDLIARETEELCARLVHENVSQLVGILDEDRVGNGLDDQFQEVLAVLGRTVLLGAAAHRGSSKRVS